MSLQRTNQTGVITAEALITVGDNNATTADNAVAGEIWLTRSVVSGDTDADGISGFRNPVTAVTVQLGGAAAMHGLL